MARPTPRLALVLDDPGTLRTFDEVNQSLRAPYFILREYGSGQRLVDLVNRLQDTSVGEDLAQRMLLLVHGADGTRVRRDGGFVDRPPVVPRPREGRGDRTDLGRLPQASRRHGRTAPPRFPRWVTGSEPITARSTPPRSYGSGNRCSPRACSASTMGRLLLTRAGAAAQCDPAVLLAASRRAHDPHARSTISSLSRASSLLAYAGTSLRVTHDSDQRASPSALSELGWHPRGRTSPVEGYEFYWLDVFDTLVNLSGSRQRPSVGRQLNEPSSGPPRRTLLTVSTSATGLRLRRIDDPAKR